MAHQAAGVAAGTDVDVVLPVLNEVEALPWVLGRMPKGYRAIVVDNGSTDGSAHIARRYGAEVVAEPASGLWRGVFRRPRASRAPDRRVHGRRRPRSPTAAARPRPVAAGAADLVLGHGRPSPARGPPCHGWRTASSAKSSAGAVVLGCTTSVNPRGPTTSSLALDLSTAGSGGRSKWCLPPTAPAADRRGRRYVPAPGPSPRSPGRSGLPPRCARHEPGPTVRALHVLCWPRNRCPAA